jgi:Arc/MetJ-type ribon-helix-helix transcriptional regulator
MKKRVSATIDEETEKEIDRILKNGNYRNKSHVIEEAIKEFAKRVRK